MSTFDDQQSWLPLEENRDCSLGFCTIYCPQWCYVLFPPPPPFSLTTTFNKQTTTFSPLIIAIISISATFFLLITYYTLVTKFCDSFWFHRNHTNQHFNFDGDIEEETGSENNHQESWYLPPSNGLDESIIRKITVCRYKRGDGLVEGTECSVCLSEFIEDEHLRLLPKCSHAFHLQCIDTWLKYHSNCPLCRVNILLPSLAFEEGENRESEEEAVVIVVENLDLERIGVEEKDVENDGNMNKDLEMIKKAKDHHRFMLAWFSRQGRGERWKVRCGRSRILHYVLSTVRMKRSVSRGRTWFVRHGRGRAFLPG